MHQVAVTELDALGTARGVRGIDDRRQGLRGQGRTAPIELGVLHVTTNLDKTQDILTILFYMLTNVLPRKTNQPI